MNSEFYSNHQRSRVLSEDPLILVVILYEIANESIHRARRCLADGDVAGRSEAISRACEALSQLMSAVDMEKGGTLAVKLQEIYSFVQHQLIEGHARQSDKNFAAAQEPLTTLLSAWTTLASGGGAERPAAERVPVRTYG